MILKPRKSGYSGILHYGIYVPIVWGYGLLKTCLKTVNQVQKVGSWTALKERANDHP
jgi:hypothetical protein